MGVDDEADRLRLATELADPAACQCGTGVAGSASDRVRAGTEWGAYGRRLFAAGVGLRCP